MSGLVQKILDKQTEIVSLKKELDDKMKAALTEATKFFFEETGVEAVIWNQYTPAFNDGEPCEFTLGDAIFITKGFNPTELMSADEYEDEDLFGTVPISYYGSKHTHPLTAACDAFSKLLHSLSDVLESAYGNYGVTVYLTKDETYEAEYDCGY